MADAPGQDDVAAAREELTIQKVILESLEHEWFEGIEGERREARKEIKRLQAFLAKAQTGDGGELGGTQAATHAALPSQPHRRAQADNDQAASGPSGFNLGTPGPAREANATAASRSGMAPTKTPPRGHDAWSSPASRSLPSRKREPDATPFGVEDTRNKSRRTTPTPSRLNGNPFSSASKRSGDPFNRDTFDDQLDFIDLTGDDVQDDAALVAEQVRLEARKEQEKMDRVFAMQISSQHSGPSSPGLVDTSQANAFKRIMQTQRSNAPMQQQRVPNQPHQTASPFHQPSPGPAPFEFSMPGAYNSGWDDPFQLGSLAPTPQSYHPTRSQGSTPASYSPHGNNTPDTRNLTPAHPSQYPPNGFAALGGIQFGHEPPTPASDGFNSAASLLHGPPTIQSQGPLSEIINRTNRLDYANGLDAYGNALPQRFTDYLQDAVHDPRVTEKELDDLLKNIRPDMDIPEKNREGTPAGLKSNLYPHQEVALTWMKKMEDGTNKGGILADDMGLGKTISTLALMVSRPSHNRPKTNLIVGPLSLVRQWEEEIKTKLKLSHRLSVFVYHNSRATVHDLIKYDVVLTTYGTLAQEYKKLHKFFEENAGRNINFSTDTTLAKQCPLLHPKKALFHRVILDEAQCIKNKQTKTAMACYALKATFRWCLTGTPMMNSIVELYSLLHFLQIKPYGQWDRFRSAFGQLFGKRGGDSKTVAMDRLRALLKASMLRRKKNSMLDGKPILNLPEKTEEAVYAKLSEEEHNFYDQLEKKSQVQFSKYLREGTVGKNYSNILVLLLRMRQACCHPHLNLDVEDVGAATDPAALELVRNLDPAIVQRIKAAESFECPICYDAVQSPSFIVRCGHDTCKPCLVRVIDDAASRNLQEGNEDASAKCPVCRGPLVQSECFSYEAFRMIHMPETIKKDPEDDDDESSDDDDWNGSDAEYDDDDDVDNRGNLRGFIDDGDAEDEDEDEDRKPNVSKDNKPAMKDEDSADFEEKKPHLDEKKPHLDNKKKQKKGKKRKSNVKPSMLKTLRLQSKKSRKAYNKYMSYLRRTWMPAAKVTECIRLLKEIQATGEKTIIFSQWTLLLDLLDVAMHHARFEHKPLRYDGSMTGLARNATAIEFKNNKNAKVMLVSLRAGNAGLNLTSASRVIIMDPFWNPYIEMQAVDRAYRIGQQKNVKVYRILTQKTVEDRIVALQESKKKIVEAALDESESMKIGRLSVNELKFLFNGN